HFLFNTLNNIYYLAHTKSEKTKDMIAKLSEMMRYFLEEAPKEKVPLSTEIQFITDYICLEKIRMPYHLQIDFGIRAENQNLLVPPMLLMPLVENVFKHGLDKAKQHNQAKICLEVNGGLSERTRTKATRITAIIPMKLRFEVTNDMQNISYEKKGTGLENLKKRLELLYGKNYVFETRIAEGKFVAILEVEL
ncbi:MAG: histidine kinase, partial [Thermoflexibacter sp.]|nr:histidine kinase [Thermoflexibacter sp.]